MTEPGLYVYDFAGNLPTAPVWRGIKVDVKEWTANFAAQYVPIQTGIPVGSTGYTPWTLDSGTAIALFGGVTLAAVLAGGLLPGMGNGGMRPAR